MNRWQQGWMALACATLVACGGGGGDAGNPSSGASTAPVALTSGNYESASSASISGVSSVSSVSDLGSSTSGGSLKAADLSAAPHWTGFGLQQLSRTSGLFGSTADNLVGAAISEFNNCASGGTVSLTGTDSNGDKVFNAGDSASITFSQCTESGVTINGTMSIVLKSLNGTVSSNVYNMDMTMSFSNLSIVSGSNNATANGALHLVMSHTGASQSTTTISTASFTFSDTVAGVNQQGSLSNMQMTETLTPTTLTLGIQATLSSSALGGSLTISTPAPFVQRVTDGYPQSGTLVINGAGGSKVTLVVLDNTQVSLALDSNGDGTVDNSKTVAWSAL